MERVKRWLTYRLVQLASQLHFDMFINLAEVALIAHYKEAIERALEEAVRDAMRLEQEQEYYHNSERHDDDDNDNIDPSRLH